MFQEREDHHATVLLEAQISRKTSLKYEKAVDSR
jgi:hypothetical protein